MALSDGETGHDAFNVDTDMEGSSWSDIKVGTKIVLFPGIPLIHNMLVLKSSSVLVLGGGSTDARDGFLLDSLQLRLDTLRDSKSTKK